VFGINGAEFIVLVVIAFFVIGPERMPEYARQLKDLIKTLRRTAMGAKDDLKDSLGPELNDINWRAYDPRQYDPRRIVREALLEDDEELEQERARASTPPAAARSRLSPGELAPYDTEAT